MTIFNTNKKDIYVPYGPVNEVLPYLSRRLVSTKRIPICKREVAKYSKASEPIFYIEYVPFPKCVTFIVSIKKIKILYI
jgi:hydrogenase maturation factor HypF (carbamoyltransferase family)